MICLIHGVACFVYEAKLDCLEVVRWILPSHVSTMIWVLGT